MNEPGRARDGTGGAPASAGTEGTGRATRCGTGGTKSPAGAGMGGCARPCTDPTRAGTAGGAEDGAALTGATVDRGVEKP